MGSNAWVRVAPILLAPIAVLSVQMLRPKAQLNLQNAREYFREHLCVGDYYSEGQKIAGDWFGQAAYELGLSGSVTEKEFLALCEGCHPQTGEWLTQRHNTLRWEEGKMTANRRIFHDFTISPPKSVSVVALYQDPRLVELHNRAVKLAMGELEKLAETRVRIGKKNEERVTGNIVAACFEHDTSRGLDPHLHTHCVVFNATFDATERRWKALQTAGMYRAQKFAEGLYFHELAKGLRSLGYEIENNARNFEIMNVPRSILTRFSKRHVQIEAEAKRRVAEGYIGDVGELRTRIAHELRRRKVKNSTANELRSYWGDQMEAHEIYALQNLRITPPEHLKEANVQQIVSWADELVFARRSVVNDHELLAAALGRGRGLHFVLDDLNEEVARRNYYQREGSHKLTSPERLKAEFELVTAAKDGRNTRFEFNRDWSVDPGLSDEQQRAVKKILSSRDMITLFRGGAGTGKSHVLKEIAKAVEASNRPLLVLAPQNQQVRDLEKDGLSAQTVARALTLGSLPAQSVVILDEAGQVSVKDIRNLLRLLQPGGGRLLLSGDPRQHGPVDAGDAMRVLETHTRLRPAMLHTIRRQDPQLAKSIEERRFICKYRAAVRSAARGEIEESFDRLDKLNCIRELPDGKRREAVAAAYLDSIDRGERALVVSQTWTEVHATNDAIRDALKARGELGEPTTVTTLQPIDRTGAQKKDRRFYEAGQRVVFQRKYGRFAKGDHGEIIAANERGLILLKSGRRSEVNYKYAERFTLAKQVDMEISRGDKIQFKASGNSVEGIRFNNGELVTVERVEPTGILVVADERGALRSLLPDQRLLVRGYAVTSYASQGKTVDTVIVADSGNKAATSTQQWYVSISRGRKRIEIVTPDKELLRENIQRDGAGESPLERGRSANQQRIYESIQHARRHDFAMRHAQTTGVWRSL